MKKLQVSSIVMRLSLLCVGSLLLAACMPAGITSFSDNGRRFAVLNGNDLYVYSNDNADITFYNFFPDTRYTPTLSPDGSALVYVDRNGRLMYQTLNDGARPRQLLANSINTPGPGVFTFLPDGKLLIFNAGSSFDRDLRIIDPESGQTTQWITGISQIFFSANLIEPRQAPTALDAYGVGHVNGRTAGTIQLVLVPNTCLTEVKNCFFSYTLDADGFHDNGPMPRLYESDFQIQLSRRVDNDITSGLLTPDGRFVILRMRSFGGSDSQSLYALDLNSNEPMQPIVENTGGRPDFTISPDGQFVAYEETINNVAFVRLLNLLTGERTDLGPGTVDPQWWQ